MRTMLLLLLLLRPIVVVVVGGRCRGGRRDELAAASASDAYVVQPPALEGLVRPQEGVHVAVLLDALAEAAQVAVDVAAGLPPHLRLAQRLVEALDGVLRPVDVHRQAAPVAAHRRLVRLRGRLAAFAGASLQLRQPPLRRLANSIP